MRPLSGAMAEIDETDSAAALIPDKPTLDELREAAAECTACPLFRNATQTVFGERPERAAIMFVAEQLGDSEDLAGHPFVGSAGKLLDRCLKVAGIDRRQAYVTNAVKHFKWVPRGARRIHSKPNSMEIAACFRVTRERGRLIPSRWAPYAMATMHPSSLLRAPDEEARHREMALFTEDLKSVAELLRSVKAD
jgi:uracil-DNA glycosylase